MLRLSTLFALLLTGATSIPVDVRPALATEAVATDPDDPAVWIHPRDAAQSLILATNKTAAPAGSLLVFGLDGKLRQEIKGIDRPNNVDVEYGFRLGGRLIDIALLTERLQRRIRVFRVQPAGVDDLASFPVFENQPGEAGAPMGIALYKRSRDGAVFAIVGRKTGPTHGYLWQYRLDDSGAGSIRAVKVREFGRFSGTGEIEAIAVDDESGYVYYADEGDGIHKWHADPDHPQASRELAHFGKAGFTGDREGIAIYARKGGAGYIICTDQVPGNSLYKVYRREGAPPNPHDHSEVLKTFRGGADSTDGIEVLSRNLGPAFPHGLMVAMNSSSRNFLVYRWQDIARAGPVKLKLR